MGFKKTQYRKDNGGRDRIPIKDRKRLGLAGFKSITNRKERHEAKMMCHKAQ